jgi:hypothetical protein
VFSRLLHWFEKDKIKYTLTIVDTIEDGEKIRETPISSEATV